jgi:hypothetical protein
MRLRRLDLRLDPGRNADWPVITVLVDGADVIGEAMIGDARHFQGFDPDDILGEDRALHPVTPPRRVAVYRCSCGEPGCGVAACIVAEAAGVVTWADFRDFTGVYAGPVALLAPPDGGAPLPVDDLRFAADQYRVEVSRAAADRRWETPRRRAARLVRARLGALGQELAHRGYRVGWVVPAYDDEAGLIVELRTGLDGHGGQVGVRLHWEPTLDGTATAELAETVLRQPDDQWNVVFRNVWRT